MPHTNKKKKKKKKTTPSARAPATLTCARAACESDEEWRNPRKEDERSAPAGDVAAHRPQIAAPR
jgi:hypothetical protein